MCLFSEEESMKALKNSNKELEFSGKYVKPNVEMSSLSERSGFLSRIWAQMVVCFSQSRALIE
jgi:hypothetical protein